MRIGHWRAQARRAATVLMALLMTLGFAVLARRAAAQPGYTTPRYSAIVVDAGSGDILYAASADAPRYPASLTKLMTIYLLFEALRDRRVTLDELVPVSDHAASMEPSKLGLVPGMQLTVRQALLGLVTKSANDAAAALGELMGGSEARFAQMMTLRARALGMTHTLFRNASGLPDPEQVTTAQDVAILARHLIEDFPQDYRYFSVPGFLFHGRLIPNHDHMLQTYPGADGLKTGYTNAAGHNLVTSAVRDGVRLIGVVLGARSNWERDQDMTAMLNAGFGRMGVGPAIAMRPVTPAARFAAFVGVAHAAPLRSRMTPRQRYEHRVLAARRRLAVRHHHPRPKLVRPLVRTLALRRYHARPVARPLVRRVIATVPVRAARAHGRTPIIRPLLARTRSRTRG